MHEYKDRDGLSVIMPTYNEEQGAEIVINQLLEVINQLDCPAELIIVDDGSTDGTNKILEQYSDRVTVIRHKTNRGYGAALKHGVRQARYSLVAITDADGTYPVEQLPRLLAGMEENAMVVGARTNGKVYVPLMRRPAKWLLNRIANYLAEQRIPDLNSGFRIFRKDLAEKYLHILPNGFSFTTTITLALISDGYSVHYESISYHKRNGRSKIKPSDAMNFFILIIRAITYFNPLRIFLPIFLVLFGLGIIRFSYDIFWIQNLTDSTTILFLFALQVGLTGIVADLIVKRSRQ
jgi:glycosyltransferase involved in cell wall biosynthesis